MARPRHRPRTNRTDGVRRPEEYVRGAGGSGLASLAAERYRLEVVGGNSCWAREIGRCGGGISREHVISDAILAHFTDLTVLGYPWCLKEPKHIGPASLVAKNLCRDHNSMLSNTDSAAATLFRALREQMDTAVPAYDAPVVINGLYLERWFLKTGINISLQKASGPTWPYPTSDARVPIALARRAFGLDQFESPLGLYWRGYQGEKRMSEDRINLAPQIVHDDSVGGFMWNFRGLAFVLWFHPSERLAESFGDRTVMAGDPGSSLMFRPRRINLQRPPGVPFCGLTIEWPASTV